MNGGCFLKRKSQISFLLHAISLSRQFPCFNSWIKYTDNKRDVYVLVISVSGRKRLFVYQNVAGFQLSSFHFCHFTIPPDYFRTCRSIREIELE